MSAETFILPCYGGREPSAEFRRMAPHEPLQLRPGMHIWFIAMDGSARRIKINGKVWRWKRDPGRFMIPVKYGQYEYGYFQNVDLPRMLVRCDEEK